MHKRIRAIVLAATCLPMALGMNVDRAKAQVVVVIYTSGWNMIGGPADLGFPEASLAFTYGPLGYAATPTRTFAGCSGFWAYFRVPAATHVVPTSLVNGGTPRGTVVSCALQPGWNLVGDPFVDVAVLPPGTTGFYWNTTTRQYVANPLVPIGGSVWLYSSSGAAVTLAAQ